MKMTRLIAPIPMHLHTEPFTQYYLSHSWIGSGVTQNATTYHVSQETGITLLQ